MNHANLTARYRPQKFSELAGQEMVRAILSRASAENKVAPAYLFSGTRGVGKTTVARIFAKALNCVHAPAAEPCNECERCRQITMGTAVDVVEIDGASNRGIDDVRKLKEVVGYAPMEGRYKVFIIDEAHMLSRDAFNALLKTLEEPPSHVTFIMATTEPHKFPATIISRCQHYVFKRLPENGLEAHLSGVLTKEGVPFDESAVRLIARRAAGSVRDAMSLLGQVLALGGESLTEADARSVLGLAGQELFFSLFRTLREGNSASVTQMVGEMLDSGLDLGFFLREMAVCWRNMFILRQSGAAALPVLDIPEKEAARWQEEAASFELAHIHAAWQMTIDGQRRVLTSLEPALALELLLLNIAMLPRLLPLEDLAKLARTAGGNAPASSPAAPSAAPGSAPASGTGTSFSGPGTAHGASQGGQNAGPVTMPPSAMNAHAAPTPAPVQEAEPEDFTVMGSEMPRQDIYDDAPAPPPPSPVKPEERAESDPAREESPERPVPGSSFAGSEDAGTSMLASDSDLPESEGAPLPDAKPRGIAPEDTSWHGFLRFCKQQQELSAEFSGMLRTISGEWKDGALELTPGSEFCAERLRASETAALFEALIREYYGETATLRMLPPPRVKTVAEIREELRENEAVQLLEKELGARMIDYGILHNTGKNRNQDEDGPLQ